MRFRTIRIVANAHSGRGRAAATADTLHRALQNERWPATLAAITPGGPDPLAEATPHDLIVLVGGDGTVHHALPRLIASGATLYHAPTGTENLFARDWGMRPDPATLLAAIRRGRVLSMDAASANGRPLALLCSVGLDASVIARRAARARGAGEGHSAYFWPVIDELLSPTLPRLSITVDGVPLTPPGTPTPGLAIVANSHQYAARIDPLPHANPRDGLLDIAFLPCATRVEALVLAAYARARRLDDLDGVRLACGRVITIHAPDAAPAQIDGEPFGSITSLNIHAFPGALGILDPRP